MDYVDSECQAGRSQMMNSSTYHRVNKQINKTNRMTLALGIKCADGVILAADTKFTVDNGADYGYVHKITGEIMGVLTAFAGNMEPFEDFRMRLREYAIEMNENHERIRLDQLSMRIRDIMRVLDNHYAHHRFDVLVGTSTNQGAVLRYFNKMVDENQSKSTRVLVLVHRMVRFI
jgi:20S proteasome alpha/beta subunit